MSSKIMALLLAVAGLGFCYTGRAAQQLVWQGKIIYVENGWNGEGLVIRDSSIGPEGCWAPRDEFAIDKDHPAYKELVAMALAAYTSNADVEVILDSGVCLFGGRTKVLSIRLKK